MFNKKKYQKLYYKEHKEYFKIYHKKYDEIYLKLHIEKRKKQMAEYGKKWREAHKEQMKKYSEKYYQIHREEYLKRAKTPKCKVQQKEAYLLRNYGINLEKKKQIYKEQHGKCKICEEKMNIELLHIDHNHLTHTFRGLLCGNCNKMIGLAHEKEKVLLRAIQYLKKDTS